MKSVSHIYSTFIIGFHFPAPYLITSTNHKLAQTMTSQNKTLKRSALNVIRKQKSMTTWQSIQTQFMGCGSSSIRAISIESLKDSVGEDRIDFEVIVLIQRFLFNFDFTFRCFNICHTSAA